MTPRRIFALCATPGCPNPAAARGHCPHHQAATEHARNQARRRQRHIYDSNAWKRLRRRILTEHPTCQHNGCTQPATDVDHTIDLAAGGDPWDPANLQALCHHHHSQKTAHDHGLGRR